MKQKWGNTGIKVCIEGNWGKIEVFFCCNLRYIFGVKNLTKKCDRVKFVPNSMPACKLHIEGCSGTGRGTLSTCIFIILPRNG